MYLELIDRTISDLTRWYNESDTLEFGDIALDEEYLPWQSVCRKSSGCLTAGQPRQVRLSEVQQDRPVIVYSGVSLSFSLRQPGRARTPPGTWNTPNVRYRRCSPSLTGNIPLHFSPPGSSYRRPEIEACSRTSRGTELCRMAAVSRPPSSGCGPDLHCPRMHDIHNRKLVVPSTWSSSCVLAILQGMS